MEQLEIIKHIIIDKTGIDFTEQTKKRIVVELRSLYFHLIKCINPLHTCVSIADSVGLNHSTVLHSFKMYPIYSAYNKELDNLKRYVLGTYKYEDETFINDEIQRLEQELIKLKDIQRKIYENKFNEQDNCYHICID